MNIRIRKILILVLCAVIVRHAYLLYAIGESAAKIPFTPQGQFSCFHEEMGQEMRICDTETTDDYIFFVYSTYDVVAAYDWNGTYQFSLAFSRENNGALGIRCEDGLLYACDNDNYEYVFDGSELLYRNEPEEREHSMGWFDQETELPLVIEKGKIYDEMGNFIMMLPGKL